MKAIEALLNRSSVPKLGEPIPGDEALQNIYKAAFRAADHGVLRPWRFLLLKGESRQRLGQLFVDAALVDDPKLSEEKILKLRSKPLRAPLILITISSPKEHPKVPAFEQELSAAAATQNMLLAAFAQDIGAMWRTGPMAYHPLVKEGLGLAPNEKVIAFLYLGSITGGTKQLTEPDFANYFQDW